MKKYLIQLFLLPFRLLIGWMILVPLSYIIPKKNRIVFITRFSNNFDGNLKYLFLYMLNETDIDYEIFFLTESKKIKKELSSNKLPFLFYPGLSTIIKLYRTKIIIVDGNEWIRKFKYYILFAAKKIQLWHGSGIKHVGLQNPDVKKRKYIITLVSKIIGHHPLYDLLILSSTMQKELRAQAFKYKDIMINGQPRNDIFFKNNIEQYLIGIDKYVLNKCITLKQRGLKIVVYCPTHRDDYHIFMQLKDTLDIQQLNDFAAKYNIFVVFKYHQKTPVEHQYDIQGLSNIIEYGKDSDVYPLLLYSDLLITDYSSIYTDFIIQNKPVVFFPFDYDAYLKNERTLQFDYKTITPGPKCYTYQELENELEKILVDNIDEYEGDRKKIISIFFDIIDGNSCNRIAEYLCKF